MNKADTSTMMDLISDAQGTLFEALEILVSGGVVDDADSAVMLNTALLEMDEARCRLWMRKDELTRG